MGEVRKRGGIPDHWWHNTADKWLRRDLTLTRNIFGEIFYQWKQLDSVWVVESCPRHDMKLVVWETRHWVPVNTEIEVSDTRVVALPCMTNTVERKKVKLSQIPTEDDTSSVKWERLLPSQWCLPPQSYQGPGRLVDELYGQTDWAGQQSDCYLFCLQNPSLVPRHPVTTTVRKNLKSNQRLFLSFVWENPFIPAK